MHTTAAQSRRSRHGRGFWLLSAGFLVLMAYSTLPTPLYPAYQRHDGFSTAMLTVIFAVYGAGVMGGLHLAGHLSDHLGRRRMICVSIAFTLVSATIFALSPDVPALLAARLLSGAGIGVLTPAVTAMLGELRRVHRPGEDPGTASTVATTVNTAGLALGPLIGGVLVQWAPAPLTLPYLVFLALTAVVALALLFVPETNAAAPAGERPAYRPQRAVVLPGRERVFRAAAVVAAGAFAVFGVLTAITGVFLAELAHETSPVMAGFAVFLFLGSSALAQACFPLRGQRARMAWGLTVIVVGLVTVMAAVAVRGEALYIAGGCLAGAGVGLLFQGAVAVGSEVSEPAHTGGTVAGIFLAAYIGTTVPVIGVGVLTTWVPIDVTMQLFASAVAVVIVLATRSLLRADPR